MNIYQHDLMSMSNTDKLAVQMGDGWCTFPDLDNFDSDKLLRALTLKVCLNLLVVVVVVKG